MTHTLTLRADCKLQAASAGKPRRFTADPAYSGGELPGYTLAPPLRATYIIDLATLQQRNERIVANLDHHPEARVGHVDTVDNDGKRLKLSGVVSAATDAANEFLASADSGFPWSVSIECALSEPRLEKTSPSTGSTTRPFTSRET